MLALRYFHFRWYNVRIPVDVVMTWVKLLHVPVRSLGSRERLLAMPALQPDRHTGSVPAGSLHCRGHFLRELQSCNSKRILLRLHVDDRIPDAGSNLACAAFHVLDWTLV